MLPDILQLAQRHLVRYGVSELDVLVQALTEDYQLKKQGKTCGDQLILEDACDNTNDLQQRTACL